MRAFLIFITLITSIFASAENLEMMLKNSRDSVANQAREYAQCEQIKTQKTCRGLPPNLVSQIANSANTCRIEFKANQCDSFIQKNPALASKQNHCDAYDVCRDRTQTAFSIGCKDYGVEVASNGWEWIKSFAAKCENGFWNTTFCSAGEVARSLGANASRAFWHSLTHPIIDLNELRALPPAARRAYEQFKKKSVCLNSFERQKLMCYLAVQGGMATVGIGLSAAKFAQLANEMRAIEAVGLVNPVRALDADATFIARSTAALNRPTTIVESGHFEKGVGFRHNINLVAKDDPTRKLNHFQWLMNENESVMKIEGMDSFVQGKGLSQQALDFALARHPKTKRIEAIMTEDNFHAFIDARRAGLPCLAALKATPAYKIRAKAGFTKLSSNCIESEDHLDLNVER